MLEGFILDGEELFDAFIFENLNHLLILEEVGEVAFWMMIALINFDSLRVLVLQ